MVSYLPCSCTTLSADFRDTPATEQPENGESRIKAPSGRRESEVDELHLQAQLIQVGRTET